MTRVNEYIDPDGHAYDNPALDSLEFMRAMMHDTRLPMAVRLEAAAKIAPYEHPVPKPIPERDYLLRKRLSDQGPN
jgi:hypothetical protein